jgi:hypothetical protein
MTDPSEILKSGTLEKVVDLIHKLVAPMDPNHNALT